jgi:ABC-2 type transport system permease protein
MSWRRTLAMARKEFLHIVRDARSLAMALAMPLLMLLLFGYALSLDVDRIPTLIYDADGTAESREVTEKIASSRFFRIVGYARGYGEIEYAVDRGQAMLAVVIEQDYSRRILSQQTATVQVIVDGSDSNTASIALGYVQAVLRGHSLALRQASLNRAAGAELRIPVETESRVWYNPELKSRHYIVPGLVGLILVIISALLTSLTIAREWDMGTMEQLLSTPLRPAEVVLGKLIAFFGVGAADVLITVVIALAVFGVPMRGSILFLAVSSGIFLFAALSWGILVSALARTQVVAFQLGMITTFLPGFLLSGFVYAIDNMPPVIQVITHIVLARYFIALVKGVFLKGTGLAMLWPELLFMMAYAVIVFVVATRKLGTKVA